MENKTKVSCFAYSDRDGYECCKILTDLYCKNEDCRFYKPKHEVDMREIERGIINYSYKK